MAKKKTPTGLEPATISIPYDTYEKLCKQAKINMFAGGKLDNFLKVLSDKGYFTVDFMTIGGMSAAFSKDTVVIANHKGKIEIQLTDIKHLCRELPDLAAHAEGVAS